MVQELIPLYAQARWAPTEQWAAEASKIQRGIQGHLVMLRGEIVEFVPHEALGRSR